MHLVQEVRQDLPGEATFGTPLVTSLVTSPARCRLTCANTGTSRDALATSASDRTRLHDGPLTGKTERTENIRFGQCDRTTDSARRSLSRSTYALNWENIREWS